MLSKVQRQKSPLKMVEKKNKFSVGKKILTIKKRRTTLYVQICIYLNHEHTRHNWSLRKMSRKEIVIYSDILDSNS